MKEGDRVTIVDEDFTGTIISVQHYTVEVEDDFGFNYKFPKEKIIVKEPDFYDQVIVKPKEETKKKVSKKHNKDAYNIDLHFEKLVDSPSNYDAFERLFIQKDHLIKNLDFCREHRIKRVRIVHGIGDGVLQKMVHDVVEGLANVEFDEHQFFYHQSGSLEIIFK